MMVTTIKFSRVGLKVGLTCAKCDLGVVDLRW